MRIRTLEYEHDRSSDIYCLSDFVCWFQGLDIYCRAANIFLIGCLLESGKGASRPPSCLVTVFVLENILLGSKYISYFMFIGEWQRR